MYLVIELELAVIIRRCHCIVWKLLQNNKYCSFCALLYKYNRDLVVFLLYLYSLYHSLFLHNKVRKYDTNMSSSFGAYSIG